MKPEAQVVNGRRPFLGISDIVWQAMIAAVVTIVLARQGARTESTVVKTGELAEESRQRVAEKVEEVHTLVDGQMSEQKRLLMISTRSLAWATKDDADIEAAKIAEEAYHTHVQQLIKIKAATTQQ